MFALKRPSRLLKSGAESTWQPPSIPAGADIVRAASMIRGSPADDFRPSTSASIAP